MVLSYSDKHWCELSKNSNSLFLIGGPIYFDKP